MSKQKNPMRRGALPRVLRRLKHYRATLLISLLLSAVTVALTLYIPLLTGDAIDLIIDFGLVDIDGVFKICIQIGVCTLICALAQWLINVLNNRITYGLVRTLRREAFDKLQRLPLS